jgi:hypothetical protein
MDRPKEDASEVNGAVEENEGDIEIDENNVEEDESRHLTWCQILCCDFRITE